MRTILADHAIKPLAHVRVGTTWQLEPVINFYRVAWRLDWMDPVYRESPAGSYDYYMLLFEDTALVERLNLRMLMRDRLPVRCWPGEPVCNASLPRRFTLFFLGGGAAARSASWGSRRVTNPASKTSGQTCTSNRLSEVCNCQVRSLPVMAYIPKYPASSPSATTPAIATWRRGAALKRSVTAAAPNGRNGVVQPCAQVGEFAPERRANRAITAPRGQPLPRAGQACRQQG